jgi:hypothetical protein
MAPNKILPAREKIKIIAVFLEAVNIFPCNNACLKLYRYRKLFGNDSLLEVAYLLEVLNAAKIKTKIGIITINTPMIKVIYFRIVKISLFIFIEE